MGRVFLEYLDNDFVYVCLNCNAHLGIPVSTEISGPKTTIEFEVDKA